MSQYPYYQLLEWQLLVYEDSIIMSQAELLFSHRENTVITYLVCSQIAEFPNSVCYRLPRGKYGALSDNWCNGIRYGGEGEYISLPWLTVFSFNESLKGE